MNILDSIEWIFWILFWIEFWIESFLGQIQWKNEFSKRIEQGYIEATITWLIVVQAIFVEEKRWSVHPPWCWPNDQCHDHLVFPCLLTLRWNCDPGEEYKITMMTLGARYAHYCSAAAHYWCKELWLRSLHLNFDPGKITMMILSARCIFYIYSWYVLSLLSLFLVQGIFIFIIIILGARYG